MQGSNHHRGSKGEKTMKRIYHEIQRENYRAPYRKVEVFYPEPPEPHDMPPMIRLETRRYDEVYSFDRPDGGQWFPVIMVDTDKTMTEAYAVRRGIEILDSTVPAQR